MTRHQDSEAFLESYTAREERASDVVREATTSGQSTLRIESLDGSRV